MLCVLIYFILNKYLHQTRPEAIETGGTLSNISNEGVLAIMAEMDKAILSNVSFAVIVKSMLPRILKLTSCPLIAITELNTVTTEALNTDVFFSEKQASTHYLIELDQRLKRELTHNVDGFLIENVDDFATLNPLANAGAVSALALPCYVEADLTAVFFLGFSDKSECTDLLKQVCRDFSGRLSVALTSLENAKKAFNKKHFDLTTMLPSSQYCGELLALEISRATRYKSKIAVLYIQLDGFKKVNELAGYSTGDQVIKQVAERLRFSLRGSDIIARFSTNEFVVILPVSLSNVSISKVAEKLINIISKPYIENHSQYYLQSRIGISTFPNDSQSASTMLSKADFAMTMSAYGGFAFHTEEINTTIMDQLTLEQDLRKALDENQLFVHYQPQIDLRLQKVVGLEVLARWNHPKKGMIPPIEFLAIAEETDLIIQIGIFLRNVAFKQFKAWQVQGIAPNKVAINLSSKELTQASFIHDFEEQLKQNELAPSSVEVEITESLLIDMTSQVQASLERLRVLGATVAIDDFGTGYSSLSYITQLPFDVLKLDKAFVSEIGKSVDKVEIVTLIIEMAHHLKKKICAEGVETSKQLEFLKDRGCEIVQGYLLSRPISGESYEVFLFDWNERVAKNAQEVNVADE